MKQSASVAVVIVLLGASTFAQAASKKKQDPFLLLQKKMYETAEQEFRAAVREQPERADLKDGLAAALAGQERYQEACPMLTPQSHPLSASQCWIQAAQKAAAAGRFGTVLAYARKLEAKGWPPADIETFFTISADAARKQADWDHLVEAYPKLLSAKPDDAQLHYLYARALEQRKFYEQAYREYQMAADLDPKNDDVKRYMNRLKAHMDKTGAGSAARVETLAVTATVAKKEEVRLKAWEHGSVEAVIQIEDMESVEKDADIDTELIAVSVEVVTAHWPSNVVANNVLAQISRMAMNLNCPAVGERGKITVTVGPQGTVREVLAERIKPAVQECLQREVRSWIFDQLRGGYLKFSFPFPQLDEADLYGGSSAN